MRLARVLLASAFACFPIAACATTIMADPAPTAADAPTTFVVVRHAEKATGPDAGDDPPLADAGLARAGALAALLADAPVVAAYATAYARTQQTAAPAARAHGLPVATYDARVPADAFAARLRAAHARGTVLVVGHSNTAPAIAAALCGCAVPPMDETEYDRRMVVTVQPDGRAALEIARF